MLDVPTYAVGIHVTSAILHIALFIFGWTQASGGAAFPLYRIVSKGAPHLASGITADEVSKGINPLWLLVAVEGVTALFECVYIFAIRRGKLVGGQKFGKWTTNELRWVEYAFTATLVTISQAFGMGVASVPVIVLLCACGIGLQYTGYVSEGPDPARSGVVSLCIGFAIMAATTLALTTGTTLDDEVADGVLTSASTESCIERPVGEFTKWQDRIQIIPYTIYYFSFGVHATLYVVARVQATSRGKHNAFTVLWSDFRFVELVYALLSVSAKITMIGVVITTVRTFMEHYAACDIRLVATFSEAAWDRIRTLFLVVPAVYTAGLGVGAAYLIRSERATAPAVAKTSEIAQTHVRSAFRVAECSMRPRQVKFLRL